MKSSLRRSLSFALFLAIGAGSLIADDKTPAVPAKTDVPPADKAAASTVLELPKIVVTERRIKQIDKEIKRLDKMIKREKGNIKSTELDKTINSTQLAHAAAIFGGNSAEHMSAVAATRVALLENERDVLEAMKRPATLDELAMMQKEIEQLRVTRRNLDDAAKQR